MMTGTVPPTSIRQRVVPAAQLLLVALVAAPLLFWNLAARYLWQDEAATAVLGQRLFEYGRPYSYDGRNLITMDYPPLDEDEAPPPSDSAASAIDYFVRRGDFRADTTWIGQPWGQMVLAGLSTTVLGKSTLAARLPFALCGLLVPIVLWDAVRRRFPDVALRAAMLLLLLGNVFWVLHMRQCRYYAPASLLLLCTFLAYLRWSEARRCGSLLFVVAGFSLFQCDFGTFWPVVGALALDGAWTFRGRRRELALGLTVLACLVAPWVWYYQLFGRLKPRLAEFWASFIATIYNLNEYQFPLLAVGVLVPLIVHRRAKGFDTPRQTRFILLALGVGVAVMIWMPLVTPFPFYRYLVAMTPLSCFILGYLCAGVADLIFGEQASLDLRVAAVLPIAGLLVCTRVVPLPVDIPLQTLLQWSREDDEPPQSISLALFRPELFGLYIDLVDIGSDPNRDLIEYLRPRLRPGDAVLINYEDIPLMFYTDAEIRGGIPAFRVEDRAAPQPRFAILRPQLTNQMQPFYRELERHTWKRVAVEIQAWPWGNIPDPLYHRGRYLGTNVSHLDIFEAASPSAGGLPFVRPADEPDDKVSSPR
ncbi:MAG: glycosyltransferase family 39 protein [Pirellulales bacterium]|nr:glycosyltransferase family 39 protein [Pirellulales bacterium]